jgi:hypothetical protein
LYVARISNKRRIIEWLRAISPSRGINEFLHSFASIFFPDRHRYFYLPRRLARLGPTLAFIRHVVLVIFSIPLPSLLGPLPLPPNQFPSSAHTDTSPHLDPRLPTPSHLVRWLAGSFARSLVSPSGHDPRSNALDLHNSSASSPSSSAQTFGCPIISRNLRRVYENSSATSIALRPSPPYPSPSLTRSLSLLRAASPTRSPLQLSPAARRSSFFQPSCLI